MPVFAEEKNSTANPHGDLAGPAAGSESQPSTPSTTTPEGQRRMTKKPVKATDMVKDKTQPKASHYEFDIYMAKAVGLVAVQAIMFGSTGNSSATVYFRTRQSGSIYNIAIRFSSAAKYLDAARSMLSAIQSLVATICRIQAKLLRSTSYCKMFHGMEEMGTRQIFPTLYFRFNQETDTIISIINIKKMGIAGTHLRHDDNIALIKYITENKTALTLIDILLTQDIWCNP
jgi:hypothetical protein